jgi:ATP/maltotriose-dependent transcriptional regulator MalT
MDHSGAARVSRLAAIDRHAACHRGASIAIGWTDDLPAPRGPSSLSLGGCARLIGMAAGSPSNSNACDKKMHVIRQTPTSGPNFFLATKVVPPRLPADLIERPRLVGPTERAEAKRLTVIKAPAGFGKTSLALIWLDRLRANGAQVAWLSLDADDDEPARFLNYLAHALRHACGNVGATAISLTADAAFVPSHAVVSTLINELVEVDDEVFLFLDDYHLVTLPAVHAAIENYHALGAAYVAAARHQTEEATAMLSAALQSTERRHGDFLAIRLRTVLALIWLAADERTRAIDVFREVLKVATAAGVYQSILDVGPDIGSLLHAVYEDARRTAQTDELIAYINRLLDGWRRLYQPDDHRLRGTERCSLSAREREVVHLIAGGHSNKEIANALGIGAETVKSHVKSIFMKLGVDRRAHAVARARDLGLIGPR